MAADERWRRHHRAPRRRPRPPEGERTAVERPRDGTLTPSASPSRMTAMVLSTQRRWVTPVSSGLGSSRAPMVFPRTIVLTVARKTRYVHPLSSFLSLVDLGLGFMVLPNQIRFFLLLISTPI